MKDTCGNIFNGEQMKTLGPPKSHSLLGLMWHLQVFPEKGCSVLPWCRQGGAHTSVYLVCVCVCVCVEWICVVRLQVFKAAVDCVHVPIFLTMPVHTERLDLLLAAQTSTPGKHSAPWPLNRGFHGPQRMGAFLKYLSRQPSRNLSPARHYPSFSGLSLCRRCYLESSDCR